MSATLRCCAKGRKIRLGSESSGPAWSAGGGWRLGGEPVLTIGAESGDPNYMFEGVSHALRLEDEGLSPGVYLPFSLGLPLVYGQRCTPVLRSRRLGPLPDYVLGLRRDEVDVPFVVMIPLDRSMHPVGGLKLPARAPPRQSRVH